MSVELDYIKSNVPKLSLDDLLTLRNDIELEINRKKETDKSQNNLKLKLLELIPGAYSPSQEQIEAHLNQVFTPEQRARIKPYNSADLLPLPPNIKSVTEMISEDREER